jgi:hypothetical protein
MATFNTQKSDRPVIGVAPIEIIARRALAENWRVTATQTGPASQDRAADRAVGTEGQGELTPARFSSAEDCAYLRNGRRSSNLSNRCQI